jgi:hypothetical protein
MCVGATSQPQQQPRVVSSTDQPQVCQRRDGPRILVGPGEPGSSQQLRLAVVDARGHAVAVDANLSFFDGLTDYERQALLAVLELFRSTTAQYLTPEAGLNRRPDGRSPTRSDAGLGPECVESRCGAVTLG